MYKKHIENPVNSSTVNGNILAVMNFAKVDQDQGLKLLLGTLFFNFAVTKTAFPTNRKSWECNSD
jgi:hypothetical protein